jgi:Cu2+-exporting ATPase
MDKSCYHCGEVVPDNTNYKVEILGQDREMCCLGCHSVASTIVDSGLTSYYQFRTEKAEKAELIPKELQFSHYDNKDVQSDFVHHNGELSEITLSLEGVSCAACAWLIEKQVMQQEGIESVRVNTSTHRAIVKWHDKSTSLSKLLNTIHTLGYKAAPFEANEQEASYYRMMKQYLYKLGIAGLATMQVMMLAVALYLEVFGNLEPEYKQYFRIVSLIFATPVLLYSALPFYINAWRSLKARTLGMDVPVSIALIFAYIASFIATVTESGEVFFESISMFTFFLLLGRFLEMRARRKAAAASANLLKLIPALATTTSGEQVAVKSLELGTELRVLPGEHIPADGVLISNAAYVDESMLTGESLPVKKQNGDQIYAGTINGEEALDLKVNALKTESMISTIVRMQDEAQATKPKIAEIADVVARYFVAIILIIASATWLYWNTHQPDDAFWIMLAVLVATCPCALSLATPTAITCSTSRMGQLGILMRKSHTIETLCKVNHVVLDKTGTLTEGNIKITETKTFGALSETEARQIAAALEAHANHPIASAFKEFATNSCRVSDVKNVIGSGIRGIFKGQECKIGSGKFVESSDRITPSVQTVYMSLDDKLVATFTYSDPIRKDSIEFVEKLHNVGITTTLLTGDTIENSHHVAAQVGIDSVVASATPADKLDHVQSLSKSKVTLMVGDGINDAPTLAGSHLSVAMGGGADVAKTSADMVLLGDKLNQLIEARTLALKTRKIIRENLAWSLGYNVLILPLAVSGLVAPYIAVVGMSASSLIVVSNSLRLLNNKGT